MSHTNSTTNYALPQFLTTDKPFWLTDINGAFSDIDAAIKDAKDAGDNAQTDASQAILDAGAAATTANTAKGEADGLIASTADVFSAASTYLVGDLVLYNNLLYKCTTAVTTPGAWTGATNWTRTTLEDNITDVKGSLTTLTSTVSGLSSSVTTINNNLDGVKFKTFILEGNSDTFSPLYNTFCVGFVGRGRAAAYIGSNTDIQTLVSAGADIAGFKVTDKNQIRIVNNSNYTSAGFFLYD